MRTAGDTAEHDGLGADPYSVVEINGVGQEIECRAGMVVSARQDETTLGNRDIRANDDSRQIVYPDFLADPGMITDAELPGVFDIDCWLYDHSFTDLCTKSPQQRHFNGRQDIEWVFEENDIRKIPCDLHNDRRADFECGSEG